MTAALLCPAAVAFAGPGDLDASFGDGGRVFIDVPGDTDLAATAVLQPDGRLVIGRGNDAANDDFSVLRLGVDGSPDHTFDDDGRTSLDAPEIKGTTRVVLLQADGKIVAAGSAHNTSGDGGTKFGLARFNADGSVDRSFGAGGVVVHDLGAENQGINAIVQQTDGRLVVAGYANFGRLSHDDMAFARFDTDGAPDRSFGANGSTIINFHGANGPDSVRWLARQADGKLIAAGTAWPSSPTSSADAAVVRLTADGVPDPTFDADGLAVVDFYGVPREWGGGFVEGTAAALQPDGGIVVVGLTSYTVWGYDSCLPMLARLNPDGSLDTTFGDGGSLQYVFDHCTDVHAMAAAPDGDFFLAGGRWTVARDPFVMHLMPDGYLDLSYGVDGMSAVDIGQGDKSADASYGGESIVRQADGKIVLVASAVSSIGQTEDATLVAVRLVVNGDFPGVLGLRAWPDITEADGDIAVEVRRTGGAAGVVSVDYETVGGTATSGIDFEPAAGSLTWSTGEVAAKVISVSIADDTDTEGTEDFTLKLFNPAGGPGLATTGISFRIQDNDAPEPPRPPPNPTPGGPAATGGGGGVDPAFLVIVALALLVPFSKIAVGDSMR